MPINCPTPARPNATTTPTKSPARNRVSLSTARMPNIRVPSRPTGTTGDGTVTDLNTGLMWQKQDDGVLYNWYQATGASGDGYNYPDPVNACDPGWRLPTKKEFLSLVDYAIPNPWPAINPIFSNAKASGYWSSAGLAFYPRHAWNINLYNGSANVDMKSTALYVRCVRGGETPGPTLTDKGDGTVTDSRTGLIWQQGEPGAMAWDSALSYCEGQNYGGLNWRLPNVRELESLTDDSRYYPSIDHGKFPNILTSNYWSSTTLAGNPNMAWIVHFGEGDVGGNNKNDALYVRCVRSGKVTPPQPTPTIAQSPFSGPPGTPFTEWGTGFTPNSTATLHFKKPDGSEYPTRQVALDSIGHFEITYSAPWNKPPGTYTWWAIDGPSQIKSNEVSSLIEGTAGEDIRLAITLDGIQPIPNQNVNSSFPFKIQALDYTNSIASGFNGQIRLTLSGPGVINPNVVSIANGDGSYYVTISEASQATHIHAQSGGIFGDSNDFAVLSGVQTFGSIKGYVYDSNQGPAKGATVNLADAGSDTVKYSALSSTSGSFLFSEVPSGNYQLWAVYGDRQSQKQPVVVSGGKLSQLDRVVVRSKKRPVILVAGIMGSTTKWFTTGYPTLPAQEPADRYDLKFWNWADYAGWDTLKGILKDHYETYDCPYDWRVSLESAETTYKKYLTPVINQAKADTGWEKVDVVAHSMGGLLVRSYIQNEDDYDHDIDKFAMVGTPNGGSLKTYYLWEGWRPHAARPSAPRPRTVVAPNPLFVFQHMQQHLQRNERAANVSLC